MFRSAITRLKAAEQSGNLYGALAVGGAAYAASLYMSASNDQQLRQELDVRAPAMLRPAPAIANADPLWTGEVTVTAQGLNGPVMLRGQRQGDIVEILAEAEPVAGDPGGKSYLSCRSKRTGATGLYPVHWIRRLDDTS